MIYKDIKFKDCYINQCADQLNIYIYGISSIQFGKDKDYIDNLIDVINLTIDLSTVNLIGFSFEKTKHIIYFSKHIKPPHTWYVECATPVWSKYVLERMNRGI